jgi:NAD-dependent SIR2 family protein deacetylase
MFEMECDGCGAEIELEEGERRRRKKQILCGSCEQILKKERRVRRDHEWEKYIEDSVE